MSQYWHAHWAEDSFKPTKLQNWEVPRWHCQWPTRHCTTTQFEAHKNGRLFASFKGTNPWGNFKGTWELPSKIDRQTAEKLSRSTESKKVFWNAHKKKHKCICEKKCKGEKKKEGQSEKEFAEALERYLKSKKLKKTDIVPKTYCNMKPACIL